MKLCLRNIVFACVMSLSLSISAHATHENNKHSGPFNNQQPILVMNQAAQIPEYSSGQRPYTDEYWLIGSFLASLTGLIILVRFLHR
jgi:adenine C2-methylase RlmN of 23S rRNA A2503 and tRNA A37